MVTIGFSKVVGNIEDLIGVNINPVNIGVAMLLTLFLLHKLYDITKINHKEKAGYSLTHVELHDRTYSIVTIFVVGLVAASEWSGRIIPMQYGALLLIVMVFYTIIGFYTAIKKDKNEGNKNNLGNYEIGDDENGDSNNQPKK